ncbi:condensin-2 complex subunit G2 isoform X2 [Nematostella vectensis]|uniref:condensin-2 complex subunit G2 isoform X2 n=1 Tax=Nematostella vectensis TaxID=45351 RepID=UPI002076EB86|nr:condensin-2 complex subunit G2 isoform X2 [Nematostella vectensis]
MIFRVQQNWPKFQCKQLYPSRFQRNLRNLRSQFQNLHWNRRRQSFQLLNLQVLCEEVLDSKPHLLTSKTMSALTSYGEIYFRAWRVAAEPYLGTLEKECIQDLMYAAVHAQRLGALSMSSRLRKVLGYFHMQKKQKGVDEALVRLYQPILWRAFKVANPLVRANAAAILVDAFPLQNPDANNEEIDALLQKQFDLLQELLEDPSPIVRATGVHGVCRIAGVFWELIPVHTVKSLITRLITSVAFDATSSSVRVAVFQGLKFLVENHLSHPLLKNLLGSLRDLVHDTSEKVRAAFVDLLLLVKGMKAIKFWTIVPLDHLLARLEVESSAPVMRKLVKLLMNSFHPLNKEPDVQVTRCSALWEANPMAARRFYQYAHLHAPIAATGKFILLLGRCLFQWAQSNANDTTVNGEDTAENKENEGVDEASEAMLTIPDADTIAGMLETIAISWAGIKDQLDKSANDSTKAKLVHLFAKALPRLLEPAESARARTAIIFIAGNLPSSSLPNFSKKCLKTLSSLKEGVNNQEFGPMLDCMCSWGKTALVLDMIATSLSENFANHLLVPSGKEARTDSRTCELEATVALDYLAWLLYEPVCRTAMLEYREKLKEISTSLKKVMEMIESSRSSDRNEIYPKALETFCHLEIHLSSKENKETATDSEPLTDLLMWSRRVLVPAWDIYSSSETSADALAETEGEKRQRDDDNETADMARQCLEIILSSCGEMVKLGVASEAMCDQLASLIKSISQLGAKSLPLLPQMAGIMYQVSQRANYREQGERLTDHTQGILSDILRTVSTNSNAENITQVLLGIRASLSEVLKSYERKRRAVDAGFVERPQIMATVLAASIAELSDKTENGLPSPDAIPPLSSFVINVITKSRVLVRSFVEEMEHCVSSGVLQDAPSLSAVVILLAATVNGNIHLDHFKSCALKVQKQMELLSDQTTDDTSERIIVAAKSLLKLTTDKLGLVS